MSIFILIHRTKPEMLSPTEGQITPLPVLYEKKFSRMLCQRYTEFPNTKYGFFLIMTFDLEVTRKFALKP